MLRFANLLADCSHQTGAELSDKFLSSIEVKFVLSGKSSISVTVQFIVEFGVFCLC